MAYAIAAYLHFLAIFLLFALLLLVIANAVFAGPLAQFVQATARQLIEMHYQHGSTTSGDEGSAGEEAGSEEESGWTAG